MSYLIKGALPFTLSLIVGVAASALLGTWHVNTRYERRHCHRGIYMRTTDWERERYGPGPSAMAQQSIEVSPLPSFSDAKTTYRTITCTNPEALDGRPVTQDAMITELPSPRVWNTPDQGAERLTARKILLRVTLDSSGHVSTVAQLSGSDYDSSDLDAVLTAAREIKFKPAMRGAAPVSQQISVMYSWR